MSTTTTFRSMCRHDVSVTIDPLGTLPEPTPNSTSMTMDDDEIERETASRKAQIAPLIKMQEGPVGRLILAGLLILIVGIVLMRCWHSQPL